MKVCVASSCGGHLTEARLLAKELRQHDLVYVINDVVDLPEDMRGCTHVVRHAARTPRVLFTLVEAVIVFRRERPDVLLSTGASLAVPFALVAKVLGIPVVYVEISAQVVTPSLTGRIMYWLADKFFYQWRPLRRYFPKAKFGGFIA